MDTEGLRTLPGSSPSNWFSGWAFANSDGKSKCETACDFLGQLCEYTLHLDGFEQRLDEISSAESPAAAVKDTRESCDMPVLAPIVRLVDGPYYRPVSFGEIAEGCGLNLDEVAAAVRALDGTYLDLQMTLGEPASWHVNSGDGCRAAGRRPVAALTCRCRI